jgi:hypothetical protein
MLRLTASHKVYTRPLYGIPNYRKMKTALLFFFFLPLYFVASAQDGADRTKLGIEYAKRELADALNNPSKKQILVEKVIKDEQTAISVAEAMLFSIYGKENIVRQRPYERYLINDYWVLNGTLPKDWVGGTFLIIINSTDGKVIKLTHGK